MIHESCVSFGVQIRNFVMKLELALTPTSVTSGSDSETADGSTMLEKGRQPENVIKISMAALQNRFERNKVRSCQSRRSSGERCNPVVGSGDSKRKISQLVFKKKDGWVDRLKARRTWKPSTRMLVEPNQCSLLCTHYSGEALIRLVSLSRRQASEQVVRLKNPSCVQT